MSIEKRIEDAILTTIGTREEHSLKELTSEVSNTTKTQRHIVARILSPTEDGREAPAP